MRHRRRGAAFLSILLAAGCGTPEAGGPASSVVSRHDCTAAGLLEARWNDAAVIVEFQGGTWRLKRVPSASGARFSDGTRELWDHQGIVRWTVGGAKPIECTRIQ